MHYFKKYLIPIVYIAISLVFFILILFCKLPGQAIRSLMITFIVINAFAAIILKKNIIFLLGLLSTIGADVFLSYFPSPQMESGMTFFLITQIIYAVYLFHFDENKKRQFIISIIRAFLMILLPLIAFLVLKDNKAYLEKGYVIIVAMLYLPNLILNMVTAFLMKNILMGIGFILFLFCDVFLGVNVLCSSIMPLPSSHPFMVFLNLLNWPWLFYIPSQVLLVLSEKKGSQFLQNILSFKEK